MQSFPDLARKTLISASGGTTPIWRADGRELFFRSPDDHLMAARIATNGTEIDSDTPAPLFALPGGPYRTSGNVPWYAASRDGQRFLVNTFAEDAPPITVLLNWRPKN